MQRFIKKPYTHFFCIGEGGSRMIRANIDAFRQIRDHSIPFKTNVMLILCVFSGSDVGSKRRLLYSLLHPTTKHFNHLIWDILSSPAPEADSSQLTRGGSKVQRPCQSTIVGGACAELRHSDRALRMAWFEKGDFKIGRGGGWPDSRLVASDFFVQKILYCVVSLRLFICSRLRRKDYKAKNRLNCLHVCGLPWF